MKVLPSRRGVLRSMATGGLLWPGMLSELLADRSNPPADRSNPPTDRSNPPTDRSNPPTDRPNPLAPRAPHFPPRVKRVIFLFMTGGVSHVDTFDPKPYLNRHHDQEKKRGNYYKGSGWAFRPRGQCGTEVSDLFPHIGDQMDDICLIRSMQNINGDHFGATIGIHTGSATFKRPSIGSWVSYGLGTVNQNLPSFLVISPGLPYAGGQVWGADFLPVHHQGTRIVPSDRPIPNMVPRAASQGLQRSELEMLAYFNRQHLNGREHDSQLTARIKSFETAFGMQMAAPEAFDLSQESQSTLRLYGLERSDDTQGFGWQCLVARRLAERGVRFIELIDGDSNVDSNWDAHADMGIYNRLARNVDRPIAGLLQDLKLRGMLDETLVVFTTEFGRTPLVPAPGTSGRGHHARVYSSWLAGGGVRGGMVFGASDDLGTDVATDKVTVHDFQATILQQLGLSHEHLTYRHAGRDFRLTDVHGRVVKEILS